MYCYKRSWLTDEEQTKLQSIITNILLWSVSTSYHDNNSYLAFPAGDGAGHDLVFHLFQASHFLAVVLEHKYNNIATSWQWF